MKNTKVLVGLLTFTLLSLSSITALANSTETLNSTNIKGLNDTTQSNESPYAQNQSFNSFTGMVKEITDFKPVEGSKLVFVENEEGNVANLIISNSTYIINSEKIIAGSVITAFYDANAPMIMIYPPQYNTEVVSIVESNDQNLKVDRFDEDLVSYDQTLKLNISEDTEIISQDGKAFEGKLTNRNLVVMYTTSTRSIPAQTTPNRIVVLSEKATDSNNNLTKDDTEITSKNVSSMNIAINSEIIKAPSAYANEKGVVMVPLRAIAEALGYDVGWNDTLKSVTIGKGVSLTVSTDSYIYMKTAPIQLGTAPEIINGKTFVPLSFFTEVLRMNKAYVSDSSIVINAEVIE